MGSLPLARPVPSIIGHPSLPKIERSGLLSVLRVLCVYRHVWQHGSHSARASPTMLYCETGTHTQTAVAYSTSLCNAASWPPMSL